MPHFDKNENFTIQLTGAKCWQVGETPMVAAAPDSYTLGSATITPALAPLLAEAPRPPERAVDLEPGTLLYRRIPVVRFNAMADVRNLS